MDYSYKKITLAELAVILDYSAPLGFDTETIGFYGKIRLASFYQKGWDVPVIVEWPNPFELAAMLTKAHCVMHNAAYDISTVQDQMGKVLWMPERFDDTFFAARLHFYRNDGFGLDKVVGYVLGYNPYTELGDHSESDWSVPVLSVEQERYSAMDARFLMDVYDAVQPAFEEYSYRLDILMARYCLDFQCNGMPIDRARLDQRYRENVAQIAKLDLRINCNSYIQVRAYIGSNMSDDLGLAKLIHQGNERAGVVREVRGLTKNNSFLNKFVETMVDGCIFGHFGVGARSGRTTCKDQNLQQHPRDLKCLVGLPEDGDEVIIFSDFAQIQLRGVCVVTGDVAMEKLFRAGADLHNYVAQMTHGDNFTKTHRQIAKTENFGLLFGAGIVVFGNILLADAGIWLSDEDLTKLRNKWINLWQQIKAWQSRGIKDWKNGKPWQTPLGRKYMAKMMTDQLAMQIQGFEAEVAKLALHYMWPRLIDLNARIPDDMPRIRLRNFMHDSYLFTGPKIEWVYKEASEIIATAMQEAWTEMCQAVLIKDLPMPVKVRTGFNWEDIDKNDVFIYEHKQ